MMTLVTFTSVCVLLLSPCTAAPSETTVLPLRLSKPWHVPTLLTFRGGAAGDDPSDLSPPDEPPVAQTEDSPSIATEEVSPEEIYQPPSAQQTSFPESTPTILPQPNGGTTALPTTLKPLTDHVKVHLGCILAANSGYLNGLTLGGLLGSSQAVAAVTGAWTSSAVAAGSSKGMNVVMNGLTMMASYFMGSLFTAFCNPQALDSSTLRPHVLLVMASLVLLVALLEMPPLFCYSLLALANGMQNSWTSMLVKGNVLRTAHMSGCTSDMGTFCGQALRGNSENLWKLSIFARVSSSFWMGGVLAVLMADRLDELSFMVSVAVYLGVYGYLMRPSFSPNLMTKKKLA